MSDDPEMLKSMSTLQACVGLLLKTSKTQSECIKSLVVELCKCEVAIEKLGASVCQLTELLAAPEGPKN